jgi:hypothetical protein
MSVLGAAAFPHLRDKVAARSGVTSTAKLGIQLYSVRDAIKTDMAGALRRVAALGFEGVETAFWPDGVRRTTDCASDYTIIGGSFATRSAAAMSSKCCSMKSTPTSSSKWTRTG